MRLNFFTDRACFTEEEIKALNILAKISCYVNGVDLDCEQCPCRCNENRHNACISAIAEEILEAEGTDIERSII